MRQTQHVARSVGRVFCSTIETRMLLFHLYTIHNRPFILLRAAHSLTRSRAARARHSRPSCTVPAPEILLPLTLLATVALTARTTLPQARAVSADSMTAPEPGRLAGFPSLRSGGLESDAVAAVVIKFIPDDDDKFHELKFCSFFFFPEASVRHLLLLTPSLFY